MQIHFTNPLYWIDSEAEKTLDLKKALDKELHESRFDNISGNSL